MGSSRSDSAPIEPEAITVRVPTAIRMLGLSRSKFYLLMAEGQFEIVKVGRCTLVIVASLRSFIERLRN